MTIAEAHEIILFQLNKEVTGYISPEQRDLALNRAQVAEFLDLAGDDEDFVPGARITKKGYGSSQYIDDELKVFVQSSDLTSTADGVVTLPADYFRGIAVTDSDGDPISVLTPDKVAARVNGAVVRYNAHRPVAEYVSNQIVIRPKRSINVTLYYLRYPVDMLFSYTLSGRVVTQDAGTSVDPEWSDKSMERIINRAISFIADHLDAASKIQYPEAKNQAGL